MADTDMFLKLDGIDGESQDSKFKDWIEVQSWNWSVHQASTAQRHVGSGHSKATFAELHVSKHMDKASVKLFKACGKGEHIKKGKLVCRKAGGDSPLEYFTIEMEDVLITNVAFSGHGGGASQVSDTVALSFAKFKEIYKPQSKTGTAESNVDWGFSINEHKEV
ncbi:type VI secretion system tube protein Hcp [Bradyrhizobium jicamae]|uniref:Type VI secretion system tube protein Hcp n=1 Tax=Bradyrhizobium jicamae TaxID=280332 RepID=A0ABS5FVG8_9BRAD|nr:type VI secretion system tube protein Hcp [Bradyrhizobium jicamae]MBR0800726.1 type VI secretion system tube protein Hcp [Bradyrhizobium jicamae]MBR0936606.1 type VI secretion system tube protein Hcp [Bradyrhizobium jicamae]